MYEEFVRKLKRKLAKFYPKKSETFHYILLSNLSEENILFKSESSWYKGKTLVEALNSLKPPKRDYLMHLRMTNIDFISMYPKTFVQMVCKIESGTLQLSDEITGEKFGISCKVETIECDGKHRSFAIAGEIVTITFQASLNHVNGWTTLGWKHHKQPVAPKSIHADVIWIHSDKSTSKPFISFPNRTRHLLCKGFYPKSIRKNRISVEIEQNLGDEFYVETYEDHPRLGRFLIFDQREMIGYGIVTKINEGNDDSLSKHCCYSIEKHEIIRKIKAQPLLFAYFPEDIRRDENIYSLEEIKTCPRNYAFLSYEQQNDEKLFMDFYKKNPLVLLFAPEELKHNIDKIDNLDLLQFMPKDFITQKYCLEKLKFGIDICKFFPHELRNDEEYVKKVIYESTLNLKYASNSLKDDPKFVKYLVKRNGLSIRFASPRLRKHKEIGLAAVINNGKSVLFLDDSIRFDRTIVLEAVKSFSEYLHQIPKELQKDEEIFFHAVSNDGMLLSLQQKTFRNNEKIVEAAIKSQGQAIQFASQKIRNNRMFILEAVKQNWQASALVSIDVSKDEEIVLEILRQMDMNLLKQVFPKSLFTRNYMKNIVNDSLRNDPRFRMEALYANPLLIACSGFTEFQNDNELMIRLVRMKPDIYGFLRNDLKNNIELLMICVNIDPSVLEYAPDECRIHQEVIWMSLKRFTIIRKVPVEDIQFSFI